METLNTDVDMVEQNGKKDGDAVIEDMIKTNGAAAASANLNNNSFKSSRPINKSKEFSNLNGAEQRKMSTDEPAAAAAEE